MKILSGKTALVTGASRGLGRAIALALGNAGADVAVTDLLIEKEAVDKEKMSEYGLLASYFTETENIRTISTADEIEKLGSRSLGIKMDVTNPDDLQKAIAQTRGKFGKIDILVNNAGVMENMAMLEHQTEQMWERDLKVNLTGCFNCIRAVWQQMKQKQWGRIIIISSFVGLHGAFAQPGYGASKAGLIGLTKSLALEGARYGITVNAVLPGFIETEAVKLHDPKMLDRIKARTPMKRMGTPEEITPLVVFLAGEGASFITGAAIPVTGGADLFVF